MNKEKTSVVVLMSGGIDSTACIHYYLSQKFNTSGLFIDYGQAPARKEKNTAKIIASYYKIKLNCIKINNIRVSKQGEIKGRNAIFIIMPLLLYPSYKGIISMGIHKGIPYYDCTDMFVNEMTNIIDGYTSGKVKFDVPFIDWTKSMIYKYCILNKIPVDLTYSCETSNKAPCGRCLSCKDRKLLNAS